MPVCRVLKPSSTFRRRVLARKILKKGVAAIVACFSCACAQVLCIFSASLSKYVEYTHKRMLYNRSFSKVDYNRLLEEEARLETVCQIALNRA
jgi:hypothetical protein